MLFTIYSYAIEDAFTQICAEIFVCPLESFIQNGAFAQIRAKAWVKGLEML